MPRRLPTAAVCLWLVLLVVPGSASATTGRTGTALPPQGLYEGCAPGVAGPACGARLAEMRSAGFRLVLNYSAWYGSAVEVLAYAERARALGLRLIWPLNHPAWRGLADFGATYPRLARGGDALPGADTASRAIGLVADHPATWGFYIGDELPAREARRTAALAALARALAPGKPQLYVARPGARRLAPFARLADVAGASAYPLGSGDPAVGRVARSVHAVAEMSDARAAMVLQAFAWSHYRSTPTRPYYPTATRLRAMRDAAIRNADPSLILWYSYHDIVRSDDPERRWGALSRAAFAPPRPRAHANAGSRRCAPLPALRMRIRAHVRTGSLRPR